MLLLCAAICLCVAPWPFANDWKHQVCWNGVPWIWGWEQSGMPTLTGICLHSVSTSCLYRVLSVVHNEGERDRGFKYLH